MSCKKLGKRKFHEVSDYMNLHGRKLENSIFKFIFMDGNSEEVVHALEEYQNSDGGFGNGLEPDFTMKESSPMATCIGLEYLLMVGDNPKGKEMIQAAVRYLEDTYVESEKRWRAVPKEVNNYPHAPWWSFNEDTGMTVIDHSWGNPTVEILGYLECFQEYVKKINLKELRIKAVEYLMEKEHFTAEHELYCYIRYYNLADEAVQREMEEKIKQGVEELINYNSEEWDTYVPYPLSFIEESSHNYFGISEEDISKNLDYIVKKYREDGVIYPNWTWGRDLENWEKQKNHWIGVLQIKNLVKLKKFDRI